MIDFKMIFFENRSISALACILASASLLGLAAPALAQTASQVTRQSYAPPVIRPVSGGLALPVTAGLTAPAGADKLRVTPSGLEVEGGLPGLAPETTEIEARLKDKRVTGADLFAAARDLEAAYARAGYLLVRVSLPPQTIKDKRPLRLVITRGYVESIDTSALPQGARGRVEAILAPLVGRPEITRTELERRLLLAGDTPGVLLRSTLKAGDKPGATVIVVDGGYDPVTASLSLDNSLSKELGRYSLGLGTDFNNLLGLGEVGYLRLAGYPSFNADNIFADDPRNRQIVAGFTLPLGTDGWWLNLEGVDSRTHPTSDFDYSMADHYQRLSTKLGYGWVRSRDFNTSSTIDFDIADETQQMDVGGARSDWTEDRLRVLRLSQTADMYTTWGALLSGSATASFGLDAFGARHGTAELPLSRDGVEPDFAKLELSGRYSQGLLQDRVQFSFAGKAQSSLGNVLASSEQFSLGGFDWLSAYDSGALEGDGGAAVRAEVAFPIVLPSLGQHATLGSAVAPYVFGAAGIAKLQQATAVERSVTRAAAFGAGLRFGLSQKGDQNSTTLALEYAHGAADGLDSADRINLRFFASF